MVLVKCDWGKLWNSVYRDLCELCNLISMHNYCCLDSWPCTRISTRGSRKPSPKATTCSRNSSQKWTRYVRVFGCLDWLHSLSSRYCCKLPCLVAYFGFFNKTLAELSVISPTLAQWRWTTRPPVPKNIWDPLFWVSGQECCKMLLFFGLMFIFLQLWVCFWRSCGASGWHNFVSSVKIQK